jgi:GNAT superfamily N-acetyltransferase
VVIEAASDITGIIILLPRPDHLLLDNIAFDPARQGTGLGRRLLAFAEAEAVRRGYRETPPLYPPDDDPESARFRPR